MSLLIFSTHLLHFFLQSDVVISSIMAYTSLYLSHAFKFMSLANRSHKLIYCKTVVILGTPQTSLILPTEYCKEV